MQNISQTRISNTNLNTEYIIGKKVELKDTNSTTESDKSPKAKKDSMELGVRDSSKAVKKTLSENISIKLFESSVIDPINDKPKETKVFFVNGILNDDVEAKKTRDRIESISGKKVELIHNTTDAFGTKDGIEAGAELLTDTAVNKIDHKVAKEIYDALKRGEAVKIVAHSQGAAITANALNEVKNMLLKESNSLSDVLRTIDNVEVLTIGGFAGRSDFPNEVKVTQIQNRADAVPKIANSMSIKSNIDDVKFQFEVIKRINTNNDTAINLSKKVIDGAIGFASLCTKYDRAIGAITTSIATPVYGAIQITQNGKNILYEHGARTGYLNRKPVEDAVKDFLK